MINKNILLIDDNPDQEIELRKIKKSIKTSNLSINFQGFYINPQSSDCCNEDAIPQMELLINQIQKTLKGQTISLIVVDFDFGDFGDEPNKFNGLDLIKELRGNNTSLKFKKCAIFLASAKRDVAIRYLIKNKNDQEIVTSISKMIGHNISKFLDKEFTSEAIDHLKKVSIEDMLISKLSDYQDNNLILVNSEENLKISDLIEKINNNTEESTKILIQLFELTISHYIKIDEKYK